MAMGTDWEGGRDMLLSDWFGPIGFTQYRGAPNGGTRHVSIRGVHPPGKNEGVLLWILPHFFKRGGPSQQHPSA